MKRASKVRTPVKLGTARVQFRLTRQSERWLAAGCTLVFQGVIAGHRFDQVFE